MEISGSPGGVHVSRGGVRVAVPLNINNLYVNDMQIKKLC